MTKRHAPGTSPVDSLIVKLRARVARYARAIEKNDKASATARRKMREKQAAIRSLTQPQPVETEA